MDEDDGGEAQPFPVDSIEIALELVAGRTSLTLRELRALEAGSIVHLTAPASAVVELRAAGVRIGSGELVQVGDCLAVEILQIAAS